MGFWADEPRALPWAGMKQAFGLSRGHPPGEHPWHRNPFFIREIREIRGSNCCNPWFQLLFLGLIPMKSQASTNSVLRSCPRSEKSKMRTQTPLGDLLRAVFPTGGMQFSGQALGGPLRNGENRSIGIGRKVVVLCSLAISHMVCR